MRNKTGLLIFVALLICIRNISAEPNPDFHVFICFGQSNMEGFPGIEDQDKTGVDDRFQVLATVDFPELGRIKGNWYKAVPPLCRANTGLCPADYFGRTLIDSLPENIKIGIVNVSVAGCRIELFEKDTYQTYAATAPSWMTNIIKQYDGNPYEYLVEMAKRAQKDGVIKGILLHQGESNTNDNEWPEKVKGIYDNLIKDLKLRPEEVPLLAGELVNADQNGACASMNEIIAQLPQIIPNSYVVSSQGCVSRQDHLHFQPAGYRLLGKRYAEIMLSIQYQDPKRAFLPNFESLEKVNPVPEWFKDAKFGIYFHWGVYSVPAFANEWYPRTMYIKGSVENKHHVETYGKVADWPYNDFMTGAKDKKGHFVQFAPRLKSQGGKFDPQEWAQLFADAGAKFAGPVAEHHDGFSMWASKANPWNAKDIGPQLDLVGLLTDAIRKKDMKVILSMHHAYNITGFYEFVPKTDDPKLQKLFGQQGKEKNEALWLAKHKEIINRYHPDIIWQDFNLHIISRSVLLEFLSYYYNQAAQWNKQVVATYKDGLNTHCAVLDYERGGPADITRNYWLTDDAISSSSWCYTEGIGYYSRKQILHGFLDRISKNGNLLLNISPKADGSIPQEQKDILLAMGSWLKKYGEAVYSTRAWERYGEGPTRMGGAHGVMGAPAEGTARDIRYTRSKDKTTLYAILFGWEKDQKEVILKSLSSQRIALKNLKSVELINGKAGNYLTLNFRQETNGLIVSLPERAIDELAYVLKLSFNGKIPPLDMYADIDSAPHYYLVPGDYAGGSVLGADLTLTGKRKNIANQWKLEPAGKGIYKILSRENDKKGLECSFPSHKLTMADFKGNDNQFWKIDDIHNGLFKISNKQFPNLILSVKKPFNEGTKAGLLEPANDSFSGWQFLEVCEMKQEAFKAHRIPGTIEAEDYDKGCPGDAYFDRGMENSGGQYRYDQGVDIEKCSTGGYNVGWTFAGEWMAYTVNISKAANYEVSFYIASPSENSKLHVECDGEDKTGLISLPNTAGYQNWEILKKTLFLNSGEHVLKVVIDEAGLNFDKMVFREIE
jgi:alpha-L-fucosidase